MLGLNPMGLSYNVMFSHITFLLAPAGWPHPSEVSSLKQEIYFSQDTRNGLEVYLVN